LLLGADPALTSPHRVVAIALAGQRAELTIAFVKSAREGGATAC